ncbi:hypothetical protein [Micromonospora sp. DT233]|uniref:hypothetical protein n=1 Tax=Micromonospora sp. DT233 TaxID=3393432 RepID=UPI003CF22EC9
MTISHDGDQLANQVPLLHAFQGLMIETIDMLMRIAECHWANGAPADDEFTMAARANIRKMFSDYVFPTYLMLGEAVGLQGDKLGLVKKIGENTEGGNTEMAGGWGEGGRHG